MVIVTLAGQRVLFTALAFVSVLRDGKLSDAKESVGQIKNLAGLIEAFCDEHARENSQSAFSLSGEYGSEELDAAINRHIHELRHRQETCLPDDRQALIAMYD